MEKLHDCYIWHIITLATMKYKLRLIRKKELISNTDQSMKN